MPAGARKAFGCSSLHPKGHVMRRPALLIAGFLLAATSSLAVATPAAAAAGGENSRWHCHYSHGHYWDDWDDGDWSAVRSTGEQRRRWCHSSHRHRYDNHGHIIVGVGSGGV